LYLKSILINGFKSFPDKKEFKIDSGITGVVGPNGSGKSNVADAVRWVLGEQSAKSLRGGKMLDVIFGGSENRKQKSFCEVSLVFDNSSSMLSTDFSEVHIARKLYRSGESDYFINKAQCRLKDILEMFRDTGIGKEGYSIIGQGKIDEILTEKGTERRKIFEEAAGIMKYRVRKEEAERKLGRTKDNLVRVQDILGELETQIEPLKKQREQAKKYVELAERQKVLEINLYLDAYDKHSEKIDTINKTIEGLKEEEESLQKELADLEENTAGQEEAVLEIDEKIGKLNYDITACQRDIERIDGEIKLSEERNAFFKRDIERLKQEIDNENLSILAKKDKIVLIGQEIEKSSGDQRATEEKIFELQNDLADKIINQEQELKIITDVKSGVFDNLGELSDIKSGISAITSARDSAKRRLSDIKEKVEGYTKDIGAFKQDEEKLKTDHEESEKKSNLLKQKVFDLAREYSEKEAELSKSTVSLYDIEKKLEGIKSRKKLLSEMRDGFEGYYNSVKNLLRSADRDGGLKTKIVSTVASAIQVPKKYEVALEVALGNAMQNIIVENEYDAKDLIEYLKKKDMGRVSFLPLNALKKRYLSSSEKNHLRENGVIGIASDLIDFEGKVTPAVEYLLARTVIVDNMSNAISLMKKSSYSFRTVTLDGGVLNPGGVITGGSVKKNQAGLLSRERVLSELTESEKQLNNEAEKTRSLFVDIRQKLKKIGEEKNNLDSEQRKIEVNIASVFERMNALADKQKSLSESCEILREEGKQLERELESSEYKASELLDKEELLVGTGDETDEKIKELEEKYNDHAVEIDALKEKLSKDKIALAALKKDNEGKNAERSRLEKENIESTNSIEKKQKQIEICTTGIADLEKGTISLLQQMEEKKAAAVSSQEILEAALGQKQDARSNVKSKLSQKEELHQRIADTYEKKHKAELNITKIESNLEFSQNRIWDKYQLTYVNALKFRQEIKLSEATKEIESIRAKIRAMGDVNPHAIEDYDNLMQRFTFLSEQKEDLEKACDDLEKVIDGLMDKMKESFEDKFKIINENFKMVFKQLFGGGRVNLVLEDKTNIMESGIQIVAEPPGKHLQNILLLSGGEKALTAIALLFALLRINPSPLCILDEIDAALDDANVHKFAEYLRAFTNETQFIVITHRKPTMAICDVLYGLAMEEKGVTEVLSVNIG